MNYNNNSSTTTNNTPSSSNTSSSSSSNHKIGPRAKCDQVVYETIAKAAEIIVRGRCHVDNDNNNNNNSNSNNNNHNNGVDSNNGRGGGMGNHNGRRRTSGSKSFRGNGNGVGGGGGSSSSGGVGSSVSRFHLEVEEVDLVRSILHNWRKSLHIPLRLDIYYEYQTLAPNNNDNSDNNNNNSNNNTPPATITRKDLLERWCIDYIPTFDNSPSSSPSSQTFKSFHDIDDDDTPPPPLNQPVKRTNSMDETILQLRQVVKRVIIFLRVLNSFTRIMPGYKLHHALMVEKQYMLQQLQQQQQQQQNYNSHMNNQYYGHRLQGGGPGLTGGYYTQNHNLPQQPSISSEKRNLISGSIKFLFCVSSDTPSSSSSHNNNNNSSIPTNPAVQRDLNLTQQRLFSSTTNRPFARRDLSPIPTPYGTLYFTALYDESLNVDRVMRNRAQRLMEWDRIMMVNNNGVVGGVERGMPISRAIPIQGKDRGQQQQQQQHQEQQRHEQQDPGWRNSYHQPQPIHTFSHQSNMNRHEQQQCQQPMSLPNNVISNHLIHNYARSPVDVNGVMNPIGGRNEPSNGDNNMNNSQQLRDRLGSDPGYVRRNDGGGKRVLSGLSLALMNEQQDDHQLQQNYQQQQPDSGINPTLSSSPTVENTMTIKIPQTLSQSPIPPTASNDEAASWKQRVALHHPPPSFEVPNAVSESPNNRKGLTLGATHKYGYGYNNGKGITSGIPVPIQNLRDTNSPSPVVPLVNTPPQPMFIGSLPRHGIDHMSKGGKDTEDSNVPLSPPFRNPDSLQEIESTSVDHNTQSFLQSGRQTPLSGAPTIPAMIPPNSTNSKTAVQGQSHNNTTENLLLPPLTKSDGLASSPFKFAVPGSNPNLPHNSSSAFSSLTLGKGSAMAFGQDGDGLPLAVTSGIFGGSVGNTSSIAAGRSGSEMMFRNSGGKIGFDHDKDHIDSEDMPFAVDTDLLGTMTTSTSVAANSTGALKQNNTQDPNAPMGLSSGTVSSQVVTSFAHRCATAQPLQLFHSSANVDDNEVKKGGNDTEEGIDALTSQLDDFKAFGESIMSST